MVLLRRVLGDELRRQRLHQRRTLREVSSAARVSLGYLSEVERGQKEASSELLSSICTALAVPLSVVMSGVSAELAQAEHVGAGRAATAGQLAVAPDFAAASMAPADADVVASAA